MSFENSRQKNNVKEIDYFKKYLKIGQVMKIIVFIVSIKINNLKNTGKFKKQLQYFDNVHENIQNILSSTLCQFNSVARNKEYKSHFQKCNIAINNFRT